MKRSGLAVAVLALVVCACSRQPPVPENHYYRLPEAHPASQTRLLRDAPIFVERFLADGIYQERAIAYSEGETSTTVLQHHYSFWLDAPARMLQAQLEDYLRKSDAAPTVTDDPGVRAGLSIYGRIRRLDRVLTSGSAEVRVTLEFDVKQAGNESPLLVKEYKAGSAAADESMSSSIAAFETSISGIFSQLAGDIHARLAQETE